MIASANTTSPRSTVCQDNTRSGRRMIALGYSRCQAHGVPGIGADTAVLFARASRARDESRMSGRCVVSDTSVMAVPSLLPIISNALSPMRSEIRRSEVVTRAMPPLHDLPDHATAVPDRHLDDVFQHAVGRPERREGHRVDEWKPFDW